MLPRRKMYYSFFDLFDLFKYVLSGHSATVVSSFQKRLEDYFGRKVVLTSSGREAILLGLKSLGLKAGDEIIVPALTLGELIPLLQNEGYVLKLVDVKVDNFNFDEAKLLNEITNKTKCVLVTHLFGACFPVANLIKKQAEFKFYIFEDCAHSMFSTYEDRPIGTLGDAAILSFEGNKPLPTYGGGALIVKSEESFLVANEIVDKLDELKTPVFKKVIMTICEELFLNSPFYKPVARILFSEKFKEKFEAIYRSTNQRAKKRCKYSSFQAGVGLKNFNKSKELAFKTHGIMVSFLKGLDSQKYSYQIVSSNNKPSFYNCVLVAKKSKPSVIRNILFDNNFDCGIGTEVIDCCDKYFKNEFNSDNAKYVEERVVLIPFYSGIKEKELKRLCKVLNEIA